MAMKKAIIRFFNFIGLINPMHNWVNTKIALPKPMRRVLIRVHLLNDVVTTIGKMNTEGDWIYELDNGQLGDVREWKELPK